MSAANLNASILIVGAGTWGCSTALHLMRRGYKNVIILDPYKLPSPISAGNDVNKIVEQGVLGDGADGGNVSGLLLRMATEAWNNDPVFRPYYHDTGYIICAHTPSGLKQLQKREKIDSKPDFEWLDKPEAFRRTMPSGILTGDFPGWKGGWKKNDCGWVFARGALMSAYEASKSLGATYITGEKGNVSRLIVENGDVVGAETSDGVQHRADTVILATGAEAPRLLDFMDQLRPTAWTLAHIKMTKEELELYKNLPVLFNIESGFFMEPDAERGELKMCDEHPGYCNWVEVDGKKASVPFARQQIPREAEARIRSFLHDTMPQLAQRPFSMARICWCADTPDRNFLIDRHPEYKSLVVAVGGSGHGFMHIPTVGGFVTDVMEGKLDGKLKQAFRWRPETAVNRNWEDVQDRRGGPNRIMDFHEVKEWTDIQPTA